MDAERWRQIEALYHGALERPAQERGRFLAEACESHPELCGEIESLLAQDPAADTPLDKPAWDDIVSLFDEADATPLEPGAQFGAYRIEAQIGRGGMGEVYRARDVRLNRTVAIKFCAERFSGRFAREAQAIASLNHPHICIVHDVGPNYLVMEYLEGETLAARLAKRALPLSEALPLAIQIADGLHAAHRSGVVHRDLKPANIMLTRSGAKLLDFGLARMVESAPGDGGKVATGDTKPGAILGTVPYMAPEQLEGKHADARADLFAFGAVLYEMLTGRRAFEGKSQASLISAIMSADPPAVTTLQPLAPAALDRVVKTCLAKDPDARWQSAHDIQLELSWMHTSRPGYQFTAPVTEAAPATTKAPWHRNRTLQFGAAGALLAIAIGLGVWRLRPSARPDVIPEPIPFTTSPGFAQFPAFSPDGNQIAFTWAPPRSSAASIYVKQIGSQTELRVTNSSGIDVLPVWSPDGRNIAFYRRLPGRSGYYVVSALGGPERQLVQVDFPAISTSWPYRYFPFAYFWAGIDWFPDGRHVALVLPAEWSENQIIPRNAVDWGARRIVRLDIESGEQVRLTAPPAKSPFGDIEPRISPDGKRLAFVRLATDSVFGIYLLDLSGTAQPRRLTHSDGLYASLDWTPDSRKLIFAAWRNSGNRMWQMAINGGAARPVTSGVENVSSPTVARLGGRLAYALATGHESLWRTPILGSPPSATGLPEPLIESTRLESQPAYSRDGRKLAFASNRSGPPEIWASDADGKHQVQLTNSDALENGTPRWSPDGSAIAFDMRGKGNPSVFVVTVAEHRIRQITHGPAEDAVPSWSKDGRWIYFASNRDGNFQIYKVSALKGESPSSPPVQMTRGGGFNPMESPDGKYLYFAKGLYKRGLLRRSLEAAGEAKEELVLGSLQYWGWWALGPHGVFFLEREAELPNANVHLKFLDLASREITDLRTLENPIYPWNATLAVSPDGRNAVIEELENVGSNIVLIENFR